MAIFQQKQITLEAKQWFSGEPPHEAMKTDLNAASGYNVNGVAVHSTDWIVQIWGAKSYLEEWMVLSDEVFQNRYKPILHSDDVKGRDYYTYFNPENKRITFFSYKTCGKGFHIQTEKVLPETMISWNIPMDGVYLGLMNKTEILDLIQNLTNMVKAREEEDK